jgi:hypothetical protein
MNRSFGHFAISGYQRVVEDIAISNREPLGLECLATMYFSAKFEGGALFLL